MFFEMQRRAGDNAGRLLQPVRSLQDKIVVIRAKRSCHGSGHRQGHTVGELTADPVALIGEVTDLFDKRNEAIIAPDLLTDSTYVPEVDPKLLSK